MSDLKVSSMNWKRPIRIFLTGASLLTLTAGCAYLLTGSRLLLDADGTITRDHVSVSAPYDSMIRQVLVRPGDKVRTGQTIAIVESAAIARTLSDLSAEKAKLSGQISRLEGRNRLSRSLLPAAQASATRTKAFLDELNVAKSRGMAVDKTIHEISALYITASERHLALESEQLTNESELKDNLEAFREISNTYTNLKNIYNNGVLASPVDGYVGSTVGAVGEVLSGNGRVAQVAQIYTGRSFALAYIPESYVFDIEEGENVGVKVRGQIYQASIERVLPVTEALPPEFQTPNRVRERGQMVRISLQNADAFALDQKVRVTNCFSSTCQDNIMGVIRTSIPQMKVLGTQLVAMTEVVWEKSTIALNTGVDYTFYTILPEAQRLNQIVVRTLSDIKSSAEFYAKPKLDQAWSYSSDMTIRAYRALAEIPSAVRDSIGKPSSTERLAPVADGAPSRPSEESLFPGKDGLPERKQVAAAGLSDANPSK